MSPPSSQTMVRMVIASALLMPFELVAKGTIAIAAAAFVISPGLRPFAMIAVAVVLGLTKMRKRHVHMAAETGMAAAKDR